MAQSVFPGRPGLSHFGRDEQVEQKVSGPSTPQETSSDFSLYYILVYIILVYFYFNIIILLSNFMRGPNNAGRRSTHAPGTSRMRRAWNHALSQARFRRRRR
jgi:hypothetical protein